MWDWLNERIEDFIDAHADIGFFIVSLIGIGVIYKIFYEPSSSIPDINESITSETWETSLWRLGNGSYAKIQNGKFLALAYQPSTKIFGTSLIEQGDSPHNWWVSPSRLKKELTISLDKEQPLILEVLGKRTSPIEWFTDNPKQRFNNIGVLLIGDVGLDYYNPDTKQPHTLYIDLWIDTNPQADRRVSHHWIGTDIENDCHSGYVIGFGKYRIDKIIKGALKHWNLDKFTIKMVQCYIEAKASKASMEITKIDLGIP